ncbi:hypothetical protein BJX63DRAFT_270072 [Aspergillus granulosus]|uniref:Uncharacterized protein n=1 Tax=Aspergillus granulosus TaxID=176169 RepID=A0ABR4H873_9EURO
MFPLANIFGLNSRDKAHPSKTNGLQRELPRYSGIRMNSDSPENKDRNKDNAARITPDNPDALRRDLAKVSLSQEDWNTEDLQIKDTAETEEDEDQEHDEPGASESSETPKIYRINTLNKNGDSVGDEDYNKEGSNIRPDQLFDIVFNLDAPREVDLKVSIKGDFNVTILA